MHLLLLVPFFPDVWMVTRVSGASQMPRESPGVVHERGDEQRISLRRGSFLCPFSGRKGSKGEDGLLHFVTSRLSDLAEPAGE
jgi:hypothetical protein